MLARNGHDDFGGRDHVARRFERSWFDEVDLVLAADAGHLRELTKLARTDEPARQGADVPVLRPGRRA